MKCFAITGGIGCGKSLLAQVLAEMGCEVLDADEVVHELEAAGGGAVSAIAEVFGSEALKADGSVDRRRLGRMAFGDPDALARLNGILHPLVRKRIREWADAPGDGVRVAVIPLLFETGWTDRWDGVVCVTCGSAAQIARLRARGLSDQEIRQRIGAQLPLSEKERRSDWVFRNDGTRDELRRLAAEWLNSVRQGTMMEKKA